VGRRGGDFQSDSTKLKGKMTMRKTLLASIFTLLLAASSYAGEMQGGKSDPPAPAPPPTTSGEMQGGLTDIALILLNSVLPLL
jgi:hypothetical protein